MAGLKRFPAYLRDMQEEIEGHARNFGLDFFPILYEVLDYKTMNGVAAYGGFPTRYPHWRFGMDYEQLSKSYEWGLSKIYEMVINTSPAYAYLLEGNSTTDQKVVMAHVSAHVDFFKHNYFFSKTNRKMIDGMANHAARVRRHMARHGQDTVEDFIDTCLSLENLIDPMSAYIVRSRETKPEDEDEDDPRDNSGRLRAKGYKEWDECDSMEQKRHWDRRTGLGRKRIFEVRRLYNDITFIDEFFTLEFCVEQKFYSFGFSERSGNWEIMSREFKKVKDQLLKQL